MEENQPLAQPALDELQIEWLGGYWKLPKADMHSTRLRDRVISAAKTGTEKVSPTHLAEVYAALGDAIPQLFGGSELSIPALGTTYAEEPALAAYLIAQLGLGMRDATKMRQALNLANTVLAKVTAAGSAEKASASFVRRGFGVLEANLQRWDAAAEQFGLSLSHQPSNASSMYLMGMAKLEFGKPDEATHFFHHCLLLDLDFKAPYVCLSVALLRLKRFHEAIEVSERCLRRHPETPHCHYHIGIACYMLLVDIEERGSSSRVGLPPPRNGAKSEQLRQRALEALETARQSDEARRIYDRGRMEPPWLGEDHRMVQYVSNGDLGPSRPALHCPVRISATVGWRFFGWRV